jgi:hypothetical protein
MNASAALALTIDGRCADPTSLTRPMHASTGINRYMHEFQNRLQEVRTAPAAHGGRTWQEGPVTPSSRRSGWQSRLGWWWVALGRKGRQRSTSSILAAIAQRRACAAYDVRGAFVTVRRRGSLCRCTARSSTKLEMRKTGGRSRGGWGVPGGPGGGRSEARAFALAFRRIQGNARGRESYF